MKNNHEDKQQKENHMQQDENMKCVPLAKLHWVATCARAITYDVNKCDILILEDFN